MSLQYHGGAFTSGLKNFTGAVVGRQINTAKAYYGKNPNISNFLPNFSDSMAQIIPGSSKFNKDLYDMLTPEEKQTIEKDRLTQIPVNQLTSFIPFLSIFQDTREGLQQMVGIKHPELLKNAIERYEIKLIEDTELKRQAEVDKEVEKEISEYESRMRAEQLNKDINRGLNVPAPDQPIPVVQRRGVV
jgi:hypothetical protein